METRQVNFRLRSDELEEIKKRASSRQMTLSAYIRAAALGYLPNEDELEWRDGFDRRLTRIEQIIERGT